MDASMRPRGQTPRMLPAARFEGHENAASMRPRGQTPRMPREKGPPVGSVSTCFNEAAGADPADANRGPVPLPAVV